VERLQLSPASSSLRRHIENLQEELLDAGVKHLRPDIYLGDEWFSPGGVPAIAIPFYLAHPDLREIERMLMNSIEGGTAASMRKLLRHEAGHCFDHAYQIARDLKWRKIFGASPKNYRPEVYLANTSSPDHVKHLPGFYSQAHPDEDFAESFAVAITPGMDWEQRYEEKPRVLAKLRFVDFLIRRHGRQLPRQSEIIRTYDARRMRMTLGRYYQLRLLREARWQRLQSKLIEA
jgi:hypothetical protein